MCFPSTRKALYLSSVAEGEILPTEVSDDSRRQGVAQHVDHGPEPVATETKITAKSSELEPKVSSVTVFDSAEGEESTYRIQSMATISVMSSGGRPTEVNTITMVTRPA